MAKALAALSGLVRGLGGGLREKRARGEALEEKEAARAHEMDMAEAQRAFMLGQFEERMALSEQAQELERQKWDEMGAIRDAQLRSLQQQVTEFERNRQEVEYTVQDAKGNPVRLRIPQERVADLETLRGTALIQQMDRIPYTHKGETYYVTPEQGLGAAEAVEKSKAQQREEANDFMLQWSQLLGSTSNAMGAQVIDPALLQERMPQVKAMAAAAYPDLAREGYFGEEHLPSGVRKLRELNRRMMLEQIEGEEAAAADSMGALLDLPGRGYVVP